MDDGSRRGNVHVASSVNALTIPPLLKRVFGRAKKSFSKKSVMLKLSINGVARDRKAQDNSYESPFSAELKVIIDKPAQVQTNKNDGGDINPNA